jgi:hypothetical protein
MRAEDGYTMAAVMLVLLATSIMAGAAFAAVGADIPFTRASQDRKEAYAAAEAGVEYYLYQLTRDNDYWRTCASATGPDGQPNPVNLKSPSPATRRWRTVAGTTDARFSIELLPANNTANCTVSDVAHPTAADDTMIDKSTGTFRVRSTGQSRGITRSIVTTFRRSSFLDFIYFTDYEALDPITFDNAADQATALSCVAYRPVRDANSWCKSNMSITFPDWDRVNGPLHTNDDLLTCGHPVFGRPPPGHSDVIEIGGNNAPGWTARSGCGGPPTFNGAVRQPWGHLDIPPSNDRLKDAALTNYLYYGQTSITVNDTTMDVQTHNAAGGNVTYNGLALPSNGVVFVEKYGTCTIDSPVNLDYDNGPGCAILTVHGSYAKSLTMGSRDDILIDGNLTQKDGSDSVLGLIAQRFVRVKHDVTNACGSNNNAMTNVRIDAAILALKDSFIVDNWECGGALGTLTVNGAIAQKFRGPVGTFQTDGTRSSGYAKNYTYDDRLRYRSPPYFLEPVKASWKVVRNNEQVPAEK